MTDDDPARRPEAAMAADLLVPARPAPRPRREGRHRRHERSRLPLLPAAAVVALAAVGGGVAVVRAASPAPAAPVASTADSPAPPPLTRGSTWPASCATRTTAVDPVLVRRYGRWVLEPAASRPHMPGYGTLPAKEGGGLLPWAWALEQLTASRNFWLATAAADGTPHVLPVWAVWHGDALWFSCSAGSRKRRNLAAHPRCSLSTQDPEAPVMLQGAAEIVTDPDRMAAFLAASNAKYAVSYELDFLDPAANATVRVAPRTVIGLRSADFAGSPTRWTFPTS